MGLIGNLIAGAQETIETKREEAKSAAAEKSIQQDEGWNCQMRLDSFWYSSRSSELYVRDRNGEKMYKVESGLLSPKRKTIIRDPAKAKIATLKVVRFKGIGVEAAIDVIIGDEHAGRVLKRKTGMMNGYDRCYHFEPHGLKLDFEGGFKDAHYVIRDAAGQVVAAIYHCSRYEEDFYKINYNDQSRALLFLLMYIAKEEIDDKTWED